MLAFCRGGVGGLLGLGARVLMFPNSDWIAGQVTCDLSGAAGESHCMTFKVLPLPLQSSFSETSGAAPSSLLGSLSFRVSSFPVSLHCVPDQIGFAEICPVVVEKAEFFVAHGVLIGVGRDTGKQLLDAALHDLSGVGRRLNILASLVLSNESHDTSHVRGGKVLGRHVRHALCRGIRLV